MKLTTTLFFALALGTAAAQTADEEAFLQFISPDPKAPRVVAPEVKTPSEAEAMLEKWKSYELAQTEKQNADIQGARKIAVEMLVKKSVTTVPDTRARLVAEAERLKSLPPEKPLLEMDGQPAAKLGAIVGKWIMKEHNHLHDFQADGTQTCPQWDNNTRMPWSWIDSAAGVLVGGKDHGHVYWLQKPGLMLGRNSDYSRFHMEKVPGAPTGPFDPIIVNLSTAEDTQRRAFNATLNAQRQRVTQWLLAKAKAMSADETAEVIGKVLKLEQESEAKAGDLAKLSGTWRWEKMDLRFLADGIVAQRDGRKVGRWGWLTAAQLRFVVVLNGGKKAEDIFMVDTPTAEKGNQVAAHRLHADYILVTRTPPP